MLTQRKFNKVLRLQTLISPNLEDSKPQHNKQCRFLKVRNETFQMYICNCFNRLRFLTEVSTRLQKCTFLDNLKTMTRKGNMKTKHMTPFFSSTFSALTVCSIHF